jgi:hypothetical protein
MIENALATLIAKDEIRELAQLYSRGLPAGDELRRAIEPAVRARGAGVGGAIYGFAGRNSQAPAKAMPRRWRRSRPSRNA